MKEHDIENDTEAAILKAAEREFIKRGYAGAKTIEIAKNAGVNRAMLHYYFRTKENLFAKVFELKIRELTDSLLSVIGQDLPFFEKIKTGIEAHFDCVAMNPNLPFFILNEVLIDENRAKEVRLLVIPIISRIYDSLETEIKKEVEAGTIRPIETVDLLYNIISLNVCSFSVFPIIDKVFNVSREEYQTFLERRKKENVEMIIKRLRV